LRRNVGAQSFRVSVVSLLVWTSITQPQNAGRFVIAPFSAKRPGGAPLRRAGREPTCPAVSTEVRAGASPRIGSRRITSVTRIDAQQCGVLSSVVLMRTLAQGHGGRQGRSQTLGCLGLRAIERAGPGFATFAFGADAKPRLAPRRPTAREPARPPTRTDSARTSAACRAEGEMRVVVCPASPSVGQRQQHRWRDSSPVAEGTDREVHRGVIENVRGGAEDAHGAPHKQARSTRR